jgi:D-aminopeptidase
MPEIGAPTEPRCRARELGISLGRFKPGKWNALTDVAGVRVGHSTVIRGGGALKVGKGPVRTGVTAILPNTTNVFQERVVGGGFVLNGAGEVSGMTQLLEWGLVETPIFLTNTLSVGAVSDAAVKWMVERFPGIGDEHDVIIPLVGECDDSWLNDIAGRHVKDEHVYEALRTASDGPVAEGNVGGGTGMITCDFKAGIGTSSRKLPEALGGYTVGVLVMSNFGVMRQLRIGGLPVGEVLDARYRQVQRRSKDYGSIIAVIATDAPLITHQLNRLAKRAALGIGRVGSSAMHGSGEIVLAFSTANQVPRETRKMVYRMKILLDQRLDPLYEAVIEATEEAILNALCMARDLDGVNGNLSKALPLADVKELVTRWQEESARQAAAPPPPGYRPSSEPATRVRATLPAAKPSAVRGAEGMARPARPPGVPGTTRVERQDGRSDSQEAKRDAAEPRREAEPARSPAPADASPAREAKDAPVPRADGGPPKG